MTCRCTLHPRKGHIDPCRACAANHVPTSREAAVPTSGVGVPQPLREASATRREDHGASAGASTTPAFGRTALSERHSPVLVPSGRPERIHGTRADNESRPPERVGRSTTAGVE